MEPITIRELPVEEWEIYREISMDFFVKEPTATSFSAEEYTYFIDEDWMNEIQKHIASGGAIFVAQDRGETIGIAAAYRETSIKQAHIAVIFRFYIKEEYRGAGIGSQLFSTILAHLEADSAITKINLDVTTTQAAAIDMYTGAGFAIVGTLKHEYLIDNTYYDVFEMEKYR